MLHSVSKSLKFNRRDDGEEGRGKVGGERKGVDNSELGCGSGNRLL